MSYLNPTDLARKACPYFPYCSCLDFLRRAQRSLALASRRDAFTTGRECCKTRCSRDGIHRSFSTVAKDKGGRSCLNLKERDFVRSVLARVIIVSSGRSRVQLEGTNRNIVFVLGLYSQIYIAKKLELPSLIRRWLE
jgi:hypothetical protein